MKKLLALLLALIMLLSLSACGESGQKESEYSNSMKAAAETGVFGQGGKLAVYYTNQDQYVKKFIREPYLAESPEEVGAILRYTTEGDSTIFVLTDARDGSEIGSRTYTAYELQNTKTTSDYIEGMVSLVEGWAVDRWMIYSEKRSYQELCAALYASEDLLPGCKLLYYDPEKDEFDDRDPERYLGEDLIAEDPEEAGAFLLTREDGKEVGEKTVITLRRAGKDTPDIISRTFTDGNRSNAPGVNYKKDSIQYWIDYEAELYFHGRDFTLALATEKMGGGDKIIGYDVAAEVYTARFIPRELLASSPAEVGLIARIKYDGWNTVTEKYALFGIAPGTDVTLDKECITIELVDPETGLVFDSLSVEADSPKSVSSDEKHVVCYVGETEVAGFLQYESEFFLSSRN